MKRIRSVWKVLLVFFATAMIPLLLMGCGKKEEPAPAEQPSKTRKRARILILGLGFLVGLLLGWLVIGWWLWPVKWTNSNPWDLRSDHQRTFVRLVAEDYWQTGDIQQARLVVDGWDQEALTNLIAAMANEAPSLEEREHLAALAEALQMPKPPVVSFTSLLGQEVLLFSALLVAAPLLAAVVYVAYPLVRSQGGARLRGSAPGEGLPGEALGEFEDEESDEYDDEYGEYGEDEEYDDDLVIGGGEADEEIGEDEDTKSDSDYSGIIIAVCVVLVGLIVYFLLKFFVFKKR